MHHDPERIYNMFVCVRIACMRVRLLTGQSVSAEQSIDGHIRALHGIWPMADRYMRTAAGYGNEKEGKSHAHCMYNYNGAIDEG